MPEAQDRNSICPDDLRALPLADIAQFRLLAGSPGVCEGPPVSLAQLAARIAAADTAAGRASYRLERTEIVQIQSLASGPTYFVHFTPGRAERPMHPPGCPICLPRVRESGQNYAVIRLLDWELTLLANPWGYMPQCTTWATREHLPQACGLADSPNSWRTIFELMLQLCSRLGDHVVGFNELAGNSLDHLHFVSHQPVNGLGLYAVQQCAARLSRRERLDVARVGAPQLYPIELWRIGISDPRKAAAAASALVAEWKAVGGPSASANCAAVMEDGHPVLYAFPRSTLLRAWGWRSSPAVMEMMGVFIASDPAEMTRVRDGLFDHSHFSRILSSLRPPLLGPSGAFKVSVRAARGASAEHRFSGLSASAGVRSAAKGGR